jgi:hypothetical protein
LVALSLTFAVSPASAQTSAVVPQLLDGDQLSDHLLYSELQTDDTGILSVDLLRLVLKRAKRWSVVADEVRVSKEIDLLESTVD